MKRGAKPNPAYKATHLALDNNTLRELLDNLQATVQSNTAEIQNLRQQITNIEEHVSNNNDSIKMLSNIINKTQQTIDDMLNIETQNT